MIHKTEPRLTVPTKNQQLNQFQPKQPTNLEEEQQQPAKLDEPILDRAEHVAGVFIRVYRKSLKSLLMDQS